MPIIHTHGRVSSDELSSLPDLSPSNATKLDLEHMDEKAPVDNGFQTFDNQCVDRDTSNFVNYGWANMGSFDDLDRILSNNDLVYGDINISNTDAVRPSPKDVIAPLEKSDFLSISSPSLQLGALRSDREDVENQTNDLVYPIGTVNVAVPDDVAIGKMVRQRKSSRCQKMAHDKSEATRSQISCGPWFSHGNQGKELEAQYGQHIKGSTSKRPAVPALPQCHSGEEHQQVPVGISYLSDKIPNVPMMPLSMTPQEKIEKLRRRQQMQAMRAIRKQQQQFGRQVSCNDSDNVEIDGIPTMINKVTFEDTLLRQLENVISRLGTQIRLCIRDSLFRLAQNSLQRQCAVDTSSPNKSTRDENVLSEERLTSKESLPRTPDSERETNHIDRMVAHLLFHRPLELQSNVKLPLERAKTLTDFPSEFLNESHDNDPLSCLAGKEHKTKSSCFDGSEITSNNKTANGSVVETETSSHG